MSNPFPTDDFDYCTESETATQDVSGNVQARNDLVATPNKIPKEMLPGLTFEPFSTENYRSTEIIGDRVDEIGLCDLITMGNEAQEHLISGFEDGFSHRKLLKLVLDEKVPSVLGLVAITGLPESHKSVVLKKLMLKSIRFKHGRACDMFLKYLQERYNQESLSAYELPIIGSGSNYHTWFLAYKRCSATLFVLSALLQKQGLSKQAIEFVEDESDASILTSKLLDGQLKWLYKEMVANYRQLVSVKHEQMVDLLRSGVCLINVFDLGINRALQEFFNIISHFCPNLVRLAFFDLKRDAQSFLFPFEPSSSSQRIGGELIKWRPRLHHLIQSPNPRKNLFVATYVDERALSLMPKAQQLIKDEVELKHKHNVERNDTHKYQQPELYALNVDGNDEDYAEFREKIDEKIYDLPRIDLPLKWIFLRSSLAVHQKNSLCIQVKEIESLGSELGMDKEEVEKFLTHFTSCGSLLHIPQVPSLNENVIINIPRFAKCLDVFFYSKGHQQGAFLEERGIVSLKEAKEKIPGAAEFVLKTLVDIGMAAEVSSDQLKQQKSGDESLEVFYYLPSARAVKLKKKKKSSSAYIVTSKSDLPVDSQARLTSIILKKFPSFQLAPSKYYNRTLFVHRENGETNVPRLTITFHGEMTELRVKMKGVDQAKFRSSVDICTNILEVCLRHLGEQEIKFNIGLQCLGDPAAEYHFLFSGIDKSDESRDESSKKSKAEDDKAEECCTKCLNAKKELQTDPKRISWKQAAAKCQKIATEYVDSLIMTQERLVFPVLCKLARILKEANLKPSDQEELISKLGFGDKDKEEIKLFSKSRKYMMMLLKWEEKFGSVGTTRKLASILRECKLLKAANLVAYEYVSPPSPTEEMQLMEN